ncbi:hypothetical protein L7F22_033084, partial [Adiantum nelumboides]|nr:hypothetical protein [Adiantum nelumboides]
MGGFTTASIFELDAAYPFWLFGYPLCELNLTLFSVHEVAMVLSFVSPLDFATVGQVMLDVGDGSLLFAVWVWSAFLLCFGSRGVEKHQGSKGRSAIVRAIKVQGLRFVLQCRMVGRGAMVLWVAESMIVCGWVQCSLCLGSGYVTISECFLYQ